MVSHDLTAIRQTSHRMIFLEEKIRFDGPTDLFPDLETLADLRVLLLLTMAQSTFTQVLRGLNDLLPDIGSILMNLFTPILEAKISPIVPGENISFFFTMEMFQRALISAIIVTVVAGLLGTFLLIRNLALIGDGLSHVSFGGVAVGVVLGASPLGMH